MANVLEFVTPALATSLDISSYIESGTHIPLPPHTKVWAGNITAHGSKYITGKYELVPITLVLKIVGTSKSDLDDDIRALLVEITKKNILKWQPESATSAIYYTTYPYDTAEAHSILSKAHRDAFIVGDFTITLMADPFAWGAEQTIQVVENLCPNWNMEDFTVANVPDDWDVTETAGAGAAAVTEDTDAGDFIFGTSSVRLRATADDSVAAITTTDFITVDNTLHYCHFFNFQRESGSNRLFAYIDQYSAADALLESTAINTVAATPNVWLSYTTPIYPDGEGGGLDEWNPNCAKVKLRFSVTGDTGGDDEVVNVDGIVFTCSEYLSDYLISNPLGIVIPASAISGDVPSPVDIYLSAFDDTVDSTNGIYVGGRDAYNSDFIPYAAADTGTAANSNIANQGDYRTIAIAGDKVINGGFENITGDPLLGNFDNWTETKHANGYIVASTSSKYGTYSACSWINDATTTRTNEIETTAYIAIDHLEAHTFSFWRKLLQYSGYGKIVVKLKEYNAVPALVATHTFTFNGHRPNWTHYSYTINGSGGAAPKFDATTTQVKIEFELSGRAWPYDTIYLDGVEFYQSSLPVALTAAFDLDSVEGFVQPFAHLKVGVAQSSVSCALEGNITDGANDITSLEGISSSTGQAVDGAWGYSDLGLAPFHIPNAAISDNAVTTGLDQAFKLSFTGFIIGSTPLSIDNLVLLPIDNGYCAIPGLVDTQHIILDSRSEMPGTLKSYDGTITNAARMSNAPMGERFYLDPQNGSNFATLEKWADASNNEYGQFIRDVKLTYRPLYLVVA